MGTVVNLTVGPLYIPATASLTPEPFRARRVGWNGQPGQRLFVPRTRNPIVTAFLLPQPGCAQWQYDPNEDDPLDQVLTRVSPSRVLLQLN